MTPGQEAAAFHGIALNRAQPIEDRLQAAIQALNWYETEVGRLRAEVAARLNEDDYDPAPIIVEYDRVVAERDAWHSRSVAQEQLLICYRTGRTPSERLHRELERTREAIHALTTEEPS